MSIPVFEPLNTLQFTVVTSVAPNSAPALTIHGIASQAVVDSLTSQVSDSTHHYAFVTMPDTPGYYLADWYAEKTLVSSVFPFQKLFPFRIVRTKRPIDEP